jgi:hypothetical protein
MRFVHLASFRISPILSDGVTLNAANVTCSFDSIDRYFFDLIVTDAEGMQRKSLNMCVDVLENYQRKEPPIQHL